MQNMDDTTTRILLLGESAGSARYLTGTFTHGGFPFRHVESSQTLDRLDEPFDVVMLSDYPARRLSDVAQQEVVRRVEDGAGLLMVGGWTSFTGKGGNYGASRLAPLLPVVCGTGDDRRNVHSGMWFEAVERDHPILHGLDIDSPPVLCGYNAVTVSPDATLVAQGRMVACRGGVATLGDAVPLLATRTVGKGRSVAYTSDLVPHWCGGIVDWGMQRVALPSGSEVSNCYVAFLTNMLRWAAGQG